MSKSYRPKYHACVPSGWCNDPNGTIYFNGKYHLFYQHYPYEIQWGTMHWYHMQTEDFVKWESLPLALAPDQDYEVICGCCSGTAIEIDGKMVLIYTAAQPELQRQCLAVADDGVHFTKLSRNPILTADMLHPEVSMRDFRDPKIFRKNGYYYCLAGARILRAGEEISEAQSTESLLDDVTKDNQIEEITQITQEEPPFFNISNIPQKVNVSSNAVDYDRAYGNMILFRTKDLVDWEYCGHLIHKQAELNPEYFTLNGVYECPDYFVIDGKEIILASPQNLPPMGHMYQNQHSGVYIVGKLNFKNGRFPIEHIEELDGGFDFYAAQSWKTIDGRQVMVAWKEMWDREFPTRSEGWAGTYTFPRVLSYKNNHLYQNPVHELQSYWGNEVKKDFVALDNESKAVEGVCGNVIELKATITSIDAPVVGLKLFKGPEHETVIRYFVNERMVEFDRTNSGIDLGGVEPQKYTRQCDMDDFGDAKTISFDVLLDVSSAEVFINGGRYAMTGNVYADLDLDHGIEFFAEGGKAEVKDIVKYDIIVD